MEATFLKALSEADAIAGREEAVRRLLLRAMEPLCDAVCFDGLGSVIFHKRGTATNPLKIMFCAHMDEVGFLVRNISPDGLLHLLPVGGVLLEARRHQWARVHTEDGKTYEGLLQTKKGEEDLTVLDLGVDSAETIASLGIALGDFVCFATPFHTLTGGLWSGKAMDDRAGCFVLAEALRALQGSVEQDLYFVATSSEEVGMRGARTATQKIHPDIVFALDVADHSVWEQDFTDHRRLGEGLLLEQYDRTLVPNQKLLRYVRTLATREEIAFQRDLLRGGGTDAGTAHLEGGGRLAMVLGLPIRYCHAPRSYLHPSDVKAMVSLVVQLCRQMTRADYESFCDYRSEQ